MAINPDIQEKAQREIDRVVGRNRLPDFSDRSSMPYVEAIYREVLRSRPPAKRSVRRLMEDDHYKDYFIPKGQCYLSLTDVPSLITSHPASFDNRRDNNREYLASHVNLFHS